VEAGCGYCETRLSVFGSRVVLALGADGAVEDAKAFWDGVVVDPSASLLAGNEACVPEYFEVVAHGWLRDAEWFDEVAWGAGFARCADEAEESEPCRVGEYRLPVSELSGFGLVEWFFEYRGAALDDGPDLLHDGMILSQRWRVYRAICATQPMTIAPAKSRATTSPTILVRAMTNSPLIAPTLVPAPVTRKAMAGPGPIPPSMSLETSGSDASVLMYSGRVSRAGMHDSVGFMVHALGEGALTLMRSFPTEW
jgi:hypothetical protein